MMTCIVSAVMAPRSIPYSMHFQRKLISWNISKWLNSHPHLSLRHTGQAEVHKGILKSE